MIGYIIRRVAYAIPILVGVNLLTFALFFFVNSPDDMARLHLGVAVRERVVTAREGPVVCRRARIAPPRQRLRP